MSSESASTAKDKSFFQKLEGIKVKSPAEYGLIKTRAVYQHNNQNGCDIDTDEYDLPSFAIEDASKHHVEFKPLSMQNKIPVSTQTQDCLSLSDLKRDINKFKNFSSAETLAQLKQYVRQVPQFMVKEIWLPKWAIANNSPKPAFDQNYFQLLDKESLCVAMNSPHINNTEICPSDPNRTKKINDPTIAKPAMQEPIIMFREQWQRQLLKIDSVQRKTALVMLRKNVTADSFNSKLRDTAENWLDAQSTTANPFSIGQVKAIIRGNADKYSPIERATEPYKVSDQDIAEWKSKFQK